MAQNYKNAMNCRKCPGTNGPEGCPVWIEYAETNASGETRVTKECGHQAWPKFMQHVIAASNRPAAAIESTRNSIVAALNGVGQVLDRRVDQGLTKLAAQTEIPKTEA
jgi:hypothetical protein